MIWEAYHIVTTFKKQQPPSYPSLERFRKKAFNKYSVPREGVDWKWANIVEAFDFDPQQGQICNSLPVRRDVRQTVITRKREDTQESRRQRAAVGASDSESSEMDEDKIGILRHVDESVVADERAAEAAAAAPPPLPDALAPPLVVAGICVACNVVIAEHANGDGLKCADCDNLISVHCLGHFSARMRKAITSRALPWTCETCAERRATEQRQVKRVVERGENTRNKRQR